MQQEPETQVAQLAQMGTYQQRVQVVAKFAMKENMQMTHTRNVSHAPLGHIAQAE